MWQRDELDVIDRELTRRQDMADFVHHHPEYQGVTPMPADFDAHQAMTISAGDHDRLERFVTDNFPAHRAIASGRTFDRHTHPAMSGYAIEGPAPRGGMRLKQFFTGIAWAVPVMAALYVVLLVLKH